MPNIGNENRAYRSPPRSHGEQQQQQQQHSPTRIHRDVPGYSHSSSTMLRRAAGKMPHVCVVGAGVAGMRCADVLLRHGVRVTILEGRDRVGGRFCQGEVAGHVVDL
jgi:NADPH-dependent 2,4-dienoyl-CoA reductase/sulfur reductase-like enzyme